MSQRLLWSLCAHEVSIQQKAPGFLTSNRTFLHPSQGSESVSSPQKVNLSSVAPAPPKDGSNSQLNVLKAPASVTNVSSASASQQSVPKQNQTIAARPGATFPTRIEKRREQAPEGVNSPTIKTEPQRASEPSPERVRATAAGSSPKQRMSEQLADWPDTRTVSSEQPGQLGPE